MDAAPAPLPSPAGFESHALGLARQSQNGFRIVVTVELEEIRILIDGPLEQHMIVGAADRACAQTLEMGRGELRIEELEAASFQARHQMDKRHLAGVGRAREHAFAEEGGADPHPVETADQLFILPALDRMTAAHLEE